MYEYQYAWGYGVRKTGPDYGVRRKGLSAEEERVGGGEDTHVNQNRGQIGHGQAMGSKRACGCRWVNGGCT